MFAVYCPVCRRRSLVGLEEIDLVDNLASGVISVTTQCARGHSVSVLTGCAMPPPGTPATQVPS